ncbi:MAG: hypothetical protein M3O55_10510 [Actinomycetota bacterium]|nr:hypothetical protein [Actinomycetota bacterium]
MKPANADPLAGLIADAHEIPDVFQPRPRPAPADAAPDAGHIPANTPVPEQGTVEPVRAAARR